MTRSDLLALTPDTLASLANRGLVKRADKDLAAGSGPEVTTGDDGTVRGTFPDGTVTVLPPGRGLDAADCTCAAAGMCRHRIALVLAYQRGAPQQPAAGEPLVDWSPGAFDDDALAAALGRTALTAAQRVRGRGYTARVHRPTADDPVPRVELPTCTVRFPVPRALGYALTDAAAALRGEVVTLAVWAFRAADAQRTTEVCVGGRTTTPPAAVEAMRAALALADELLLDGVRHAGPVFAGSLRRAGRALAATSLHWPAGAVEELREQLDAYTARETRYTPERLALLLAELHARHRAAGHDPAGVLGTAEAPVTPLRRVRLVALGCRIGGTARDRTAETYFAHADAGIALVLRSRWDLTEDQRPTGHDLSGRRLLGSPLHALATANVVSEHTTRAADRTVTLSRGRIAATSVTPAGSAWTELPRTLLVRDTAAHLRAAGERPPRLIRPRVAADDVRVVMVDAVEEIGYDPAAQRLEAVLRDPAGNGFHLHAEYNPLCPGGLDALAAALADDGLRAVSGMLGRSRGRIVLDPLAVLTADGVTVPDLAPGVGDSALEAAAHRPPDPVTAALRAALTALADAAHQGLRHLTPATRTALTDGADRLRRTGLNGAAARLDDLTRTLHVEGAPAAVPHWVTAQIRLTTTLDLHQEDG
ncbi:SWIM zinc finger family protein [Streptomyces sp. NRRL B-3648]|uniref:SWIM zinc finger family protein n=1 Tax=Streptomyces sp. NRRL B-3648 TaxID=1519493 RepID=UPI0006AF92CA|nr:SWIM zinc finger family protein [Streptomyces sp. NRRL B-3648]